MAVTLTSPTFGPVIFSKNPVLFQLRSLTDLGAPYAAQGAFSQIQPGFVGQLAEDETITIEYEEPDGTSETIVFVAKPSPTLENEIPDDTWAGTFPNYWEDIRTRIAAHHRLAPYFKVTRSSSIVGQMLTIKAKSSDSAWTITVSNDAGITVTNNAATDDATPTNYKVRLEVFMERGYKEGDYGLVAQLENIPDVDGYMNFDLSSILEAECKSGLNTPEVPEWGTDAPFLADNLRRFYIRFTEEYGSPVVAQEWQYDDVRTCMNGGVSQSVFAAGDYLGGLNVNNAFLTWMPNGRKLGRTQPEYLSFYNWDSVAREVFINMRWYDIADNAASTPSSFFTAIELQPGEVGIFPVGPEILGLDSNTDAYRYEVRAMYDDGEAHQPLSEWRTYLLDDEYYHSQRYLQYLNGFGVPECVRCTGQFGKQTEISRRVAERPVLAGYNEFATDRFQYSTAFTNELTYRTGYITRAEAEVLQELFISGEVYDVAEGGYIPLSVETKQINVTDTDRDLHFYQISAQPRLSMRNFSKVTVSDANASAWQEPGGVSWFDALLIPWTLP